MTLVAMLLIAAVALEHFYIMVLEMALWTTPRGLKTFGNTPEKAEITRVLAANQGLYNGFLAAGLVWSLLQPDETFAFQLQLFFLVCVILAALYGGWSVSRRILVIQGLPAALALVVTVLFNNPYGESLA